MLRAVRVAAHPDVGCAIKPAVEGVAGADRLWQGDRRAALNERDSSAVWIRDGVHTEDIKLYFGGCLVMSRIFGDRCGYHTVSAGLDIQHTAHHGADICVARLIRDRASALHSVEPQGKVVAICSYRVQETEFVDIQRNRVVDLVDRKGDRRLVGLSVSVVAGLVCRNLAVASTDEGDGAT